MVGLAMLLEQGVPHEEIHERSRYDLQLEQEIVYAGLKRLEPTTDELPRLDLWPGRVDRRPSRHSYHHGRDTATARRFTDLSARVHRPWRPLTHWWPAPRAVVEIQIRGANADTRKTLAYHVDKQWYNADTGKRINSIVERWRMCSK